MSSPIFQDQFQSVDDIKNYYLKNIERYGAEAPRTMGYHASPIDDRLIRNILPENVPDSYSVLDVGCGLAQIVPILSSRYQKAQLHQLVGLDIVDEFIRLCQQQFPQHSFEVVDFIEWKSAQKFDLVIAAGVLVTRISNFESYLAKFIERMILASKAWVGFNLVANCGPDYTAKHLATISESRLIELLNNFLNVDWKVERKEVFPGSEDIFVKGRILSATAAKCSGDLSRY